MSCRPLSLCTSNCRYDVVRRVAKRFGMKDVSEDEPWNLYWTDLSISLERCKDMKRFQVSGRVLDEVLDNVLARIFLREK